MLIRDGREDDLPAIGLPNDVSVALRAKLGFVDVGRLPEVDRKKGRWLDLSLMQLSL